MTSEHTSCNSSNKKNSGAAQPLFVGPFAHIRKSLDYNYHSTYSKERQWLQDSIVDDILGHVVNRHTFSSKDGDEEDDEQTSTRRTTTTRRGTQKQTEQDITHEQQQHEHEREGSSNEHELDHQEDNADNDQDEYEDEEDICTVPVDPWIIFTAGVQGSGKFHTIRTLVQHGYLPLLGFVHVDSDRIRRMLLPTVDKHTTGGISSSRPTVLDGTGGVGASPKDFMNQQQHQPYHIHSHSSSSPSLYTFYHPSSPYLQIHESFMHQQQQESHDTGEHSIRHSTLEVSTTISNTLPLDYSTSSSPSSSPPAAEAETASDREAGYIAEIITLAALYAGKNVILDAAMRNIQWYQQLFTHLRTNFTSLRLALLHVIAPRECVFQWSMVRIMSFLDL